MTGDGGRALTAVRRIGWGVGGDEVVGNLHLPRASADRSPGVVVAGPMTSVKEQVTGVYAAALAVRGIAALAIDHRHFGESGGAPRQYERWDRKVEDLAAALAALRKAPEVDPERIGAVGVCLGAGYMAHTIARTPYVRAFGAVAGYYRDPDEMRARDPEGFEAKIAQGRAAREQWEATGELLIIPAAAPAGDAAMSTPDTVDYYTRRAAVPSYVNAFAVMSREHFLPFDVQAAASRVRVPTLMVHSERALSPDWARRFYDRFAGSKEIVWVEAQGQTDFYDVHSLVEPAADLLAAHFWRTLRQLCP